MSKLNRLVFDVVRADKSEKYEVFLIRCDKPTHIEYLVRRELSSGSWSCHGLDGVAAPSKKNQKVIFGFLESIREQLKHPDQRLLHLLVIHMHRDREELLVLLLYRGL